MKLSEYIVCRIAKITLGQDGPAGRLQKPVGVGNVYS
jgi:hypothetical protein